MHGSELHEMRFDRAMRASHCYYINAMHRARTGMKSVRDHVAVHAKIGLRDTPQAMIHFMGINVII